MDLVISDESVNCYGFRILTAGIDTSLYAKNPVLLYDHTRRGYENDEDIILSLGKVNNLRIEGDKMIGSPEFDLEDDFAKKVSRKFDKGYLNAASIGFDAIEWSEDPALMLPGQKGPTVTKAILREISITDIPANGNAVKLNFQGKQINLNGKTNPAEIESFFKLNNKPATNMKKIIAVLTASKLVSLPDSATEELVAESTQALVNQLSAKDQTIAAKDAEIAKLKGEAEAAKTAALKERATTLVEAALSAKKIVAAQKDNLINLASASEEGYTGTKQLLDSLKGYEGVVHQLKVEGTEQPLTLKAEFEKRATEGTLELLKAENFEHFKKVYEAGTGKKFKD